LTWVIEALSSDMHSDLLLPTFHSSLSLLHSISSASHVRQNFASLGSRWMLEHKESKVLYKILLYFVCVGIVSCHVQYHMTSNRQLSKQAP
jgi:hypothetical protein